MSIIADTLKRLQAKPEEPPPSAKTDVGPRPVFNKGEGSGRHRRDSPFGFLIVMVVMTITLGGLAFAAFWVGGNLDFGLATNTQARVNGHLPLTNGPDLLDDPVSVHQLSETHKAPAPEPTHSFQSPTTATESEQDQAAARLDTNIVPTPPSSPHLVTPPSSFKVGTINPVPTKAVVFPGSQDQESLSRSIKQASSDREEPTNLLVSLSEEKSNVIISTERPTAAKEYPAIELVEAAQLEATEDPNVISMSLEEEMIQTEEFLKTSRPLTDSAPPPTTPKALKTRRESMKHHVQTTAPLQPTQSNRLHHAQQLIRSGEYEGAVALLSPLFHDPPVKWEPWFWMGTALLGKGDMEQADQFLLSGLARNDKVPQLWIQRALVAQQRGDYQLAIHELRQAETLEADLPHIHLNMGYAYERLGNDRIANQYYEKFLKLSEDQPAFFTTRKKLFARLTQHTPANTSPPSSPNP